jgi:oxygen-independent coproporphyrinogen-3 oxidase
MLVNMQPFSVYLHIPFCQSRCTYCDFNTYAGVQHLIPDYVAALRREIRNLAENASKRVPVHTVFFGGGTPSLLTATQFTGILNDLQAGFDLQKDAEISLEANPGTVTSESLMELHSIGFNRISFGIQSFHAQDLLLMGRIHTAEDGLQVVSQARKAGFENLNLDLIFGIPGQGLDRWRQTLEIALGLKPDHISLYSLTVEEGTPLFGWVNRGLVEVVDDDLAADMYELAGERMDQAGLSQYEISNWARPGKECRHNLQYWRMQPYLGLGAGAHGYVSGHRMANTDWIGNYIQRMRPSKYLEFPFSPANETLISLSRTEEMGEFMMVGLRLVDEGVSLHDFELRYDQKMLDMYGEQILKLIQRKLLEYKPDDSDRIRLTHAGRILGNQVFVEFI